MGHIGFFAQGVPHAFRSKQRLIDWLSTVARDHGAEVGNLAFVLISDEELRSYNRRYLKKSYYTDVIAFDGQAGAGVSGDVLISYHRTKENAARYRVTHQHELRRVMVHGLLHLLGHNDASARSRAAMARLEDAYLSTY